MIYIAFWFRFNNEVSLQNCSFPWVSNLYTLSSIDGGQIPQWIFTSSRASRVTRASRSSRALWWVSGSYPVSMPRTEPWPDLIASQLTSSSGRVRACDIHVNCLVQSCSIPSAFAVEMLQACTKPSMWLVSFPFDYSWTYVLATQWAINIHYITLIRGNFCKYLSFFNGCLGCIPKWWFLQIWGSVKILPHKSSWSSRLTPIPLWAHCKYQ